jgi:two-component system sensor histidine kinase AlgZ
MARTPDAETADPTRTFRETVRGLLAPRRLVPIVLVCGPLIAAQGHLSRPNSALALGVGLCLAFVFVAPVSWRLLLPEGAFGPGAWVGLLLYAAIGTGIVLGLGVAVPKLFGIGVTFLTSRISLIISLALFLVGGWGLGRDIGFEHRLERERARADALAREAERAQLLALRAQLDPHFLFNTLNSIAEWCRQDGITAERAVLQLAAMLRSVLDAVRARTWPLRQELELVETLFSLHRLRDPGLFELRRDVDAALAEVPVPPLILLPLAENAAKHGPCAGHRGDIALAVRGEPGRVVVTLENPGPYAGPRPGSSGLPDLERRLAHAYSGAAELRIGARGDRTRAELRLPLAGPQSGAPA